MDSHEALAVGENVFVGDVDGAAEGTADGAELIDGVGLTGFVEPSSLQKSVKSLQQSP